jgi:hypothetical protein
MEPNLRVNEEAVGLTEEQNRMYTIMVQAGWDPVEAEREARAAFIVYSGDGIE